MGEKGPNLLSVERAKKLIKELDYSDCKAVIILGNDKVFSAGLNLKDLSNAKEPNEVALIFQYSWRAFKGLQGFSRASY